MPEADDFSIDRLPHRAADSEAEVLRQRGAGR
jgi:hypothetical protein